MKKINSITVMVVLLAMILTSLPVSVNAQRRTQVRQQTQVREAVGTSTYYEDDSVILRSKKVYVSSVDLLVGSSPEVPGGLLTAPGPDEEDVLLQKRILVATRTSAGNIYIGYLNPIVNGQQVVLRRKKVSRKIIATLNCGNWTRELGGDYSFVEKVGPCVAGEETTDVQRDVAPDGTETVITTKSDGCKTTIEKVITKTVTLPGERVEVCVPNAWLDVYEHGNFNGKLGKSFKVAEVIGSLPLELQTAIKAQVTKEKVNYLMIQHGACESERNRIKVRWFTKSGGWSWVSFLVGVAVGAAVVYFVKRTRNKPSPIKSQPTPLPPRTGIDGSGSTTGGTVGTRRRRP